MAHITIKEWSEDDRPREKLLSKGARSLSNAELMAILINNGTQNESALQLMQKMMSAVDNSLQQLGRMSVEQILSLKIKGIGPAKAVTLVAALELGLRREADIHKKEYANSGQEAAKYLQAQLQYYNYEVFAIVYLNISNRIQHFEIVSVGGTNMAIVDVKIIMKRALEHNAARLILCHNHPSGSLKPSQADIHVTKKLKDAAILLEMQIVDHIIVSDQGYFSFAEEGII